MIFCSLSTVARKYFLACVLFGSFEMNAWAQTAGEIVKTIKSKLEKVNDYEAMGKMKTNVAFIKAPLATVKIYYEKPDRLAIVNETGISFIPKGSVNINMNNLFDNLDAFEIIDAGTDQDGLRVIKLLSKNDTSDIVLSTLYVDQKKMVIKKCRTTTKENGTYELEMTYGKYADFSLPDKIVFSFNTKDYKLPKGITLDYDDGSQKSNDQLKEKKGTVEIVYSHYVINKGIDDKVFQK